MFRPKSRGRADAGWKCELISSTTKAALQQKKEQGHRLGSSQNLTAEACLKGLQVRQQNAQHNKENRQASKLICI